MSDSNKKKQPVQMPSAEPLVLAELVQYAPGATVSRTLAKSPTGRMVLFAFDAGQELSEHSSPFDAYVQVLDGAVDLTIGGAPVHAVVGQTVLMPGDVPHGLHAPQRFKMLLTMIKPERAG